MDGKDGKTTDEKEQVKIVTSFFNYTMFNKEGEKEIENITPSKMKGPFTTDEVK